jgi:DNA-binding FadR family transcriptional regulator
MFRKARQNRIFEDVVDQIQEAILEGRLPAGSRLPAERELQEIFNASRGTLREALRVLEQKGLITIKTGVKGGAMVNTLNTDQISESLDLLIRYQRVALSDLAEFREGVESIVTTLAVQRAQKEDIEKLKQIIGQAKVCLEEGEAGWKALLQLDNQLHLTLARIARNPIYESILKTIYDNIHRYFEKFLPIKEEVLREIYQDLCDIVQAVEEGQANKAGLLVQNHVYRFNCMMEENARKG